MVVGNLQALPVFRDRANGTMGEEFDGWIPIPDCSINAVYLVFMLLHNTEISKINIEERNKQLLIL